RHLWTAHVTALFIGNADVVTSDRFSTPRFHAAHHCGLAASAPIWRAWRSPNRKTQAHAMNRGGIASRPPKPTITGLAAPANQIAARPPVEFVAECARLAVHMVPVRLRIQ